jgi:hypothetical protein
MASPTISLKNRRWQAEAADMNLRDALAEAIEQNLDEKAGSRISFMEGALRVPEPKRPLDFHTFPMQRELYEEAADDRELVVCKSTQVGVSAWALRWLLYHADTRGLTGMYVMPTLGDVWDFSSARIKPVIDNSLYLQERVSAEDPQSKGLRKVGLGFCFFRGSESKRKLDSVDADHLVFDEYDTLAQDNLSDAERRVSGPLSKGLIRRVGVPSIPAFGISKFYEQSDQRKWHVRCECGEWQSPTFHENVDQKRCLRVCRRCMKPLDVTVGEWVAAYPDRSVRGYHVTRLIAPTANIADIVAASKKRSPYERQVFFNKDLGEPYAPAEGRLSREAIAAAQSAGGGYTQVPGYVGANLVTMGVDVASTRALNVRVSEHLADGRKRALYIGEASSFDELCLLMDRFQVRMCAVDHLPEGRLARAFAERFPGRVYVCSFETNPSPKDSRVLKVDEDMRHCTVRRTEAMDATAEQVRAQANLLPLDLPDGYVDAMQAPVRVVEKDNLGRQIVLYRSTGQDDWFFAEVYDIVATALWDYRLGRIEQEREHFRSLDDMLEFERSATADYTATEEYQAGGHDDEAAWGEPGAP